VLAGSGTKPKMTRKEAKELHCTKRLAFYRRQPEMSLTKFSLVGKIANHFFTVIIIMFFNCKKEPLCVKSFTGTT
jgi:hypothetical protein